MTPRATMSPIIHRLSLAISFALFLAPGLLIAQSGEQAPPGIDESLLDEPSGWLRVEVAVLVDTSEKALFSEQWPLSPGPHYPQRSRWLLDSESDGNLQAQYPGSQLTIDEVGNVRLLLPTPKRLIAEAHSNIAAVMAEYLDELSGNVLPDPHDLSLPLATTATGNSIAESEIRLALPTDQVDVQALALDDLNPLALDELRAGVRALEDLPPRVMPHINADSLTELENTHSSDLDTEHPPALPTAFLAQENTLLAQGLRRLTARSGDQIRMQTAWLQPPEANNLAILLTDTIDDTAWPAVQGFVQLVKRDGWRMGVNIWLSTAGDYLPQGLTVAAPPAQPERTTFLSEESEEELTGVALDERRQWLQAFHQTQLLGDFPPALDLDTNDSDLPRDTPNEWSVQKAGISEEPAAPAEWPYRHVIHVADTRSLQDGNVRYFDHPVLKVLSAYKELTWGEVFALGEQERALAEQSEAGEP